MSSQRWRTRVVCAISALVLAHMGTATATASINPFLPPTPYPALVDASNQAGWWKPIAEHSGSVYIAFNAWGSTDANGGAADTHTVVIAKRSPLGVWSQGCLQAATGSCQVFTDDVGHSQPSIAVDGDGHVHAFVSMHNHNWRYWRSTLPGDVGSMADRSAAMPDQGDRYTYPVAARTADGDVYLIVRALPEGRLYRWADDADTWTRVATFARDPAYVVYPDDIVAGASGDLHIVWEWSYGSPDGLRHLGSYLRYVPATGTFTNAAGLPVSVPATTTSPVQYQPLEGAEEATARESAGAPPGLQSAKVAVDPVSARPVVAYRFRPSAGSPWHVRAAEWDGSAWHRSAVYAGPLSTYAALGVSASAGVRVYYAKHPDAVRNQAAVATRGADGTWTHLPLLPGVAIQRLAVLRHGTGDQLYLVAPTEHQLYQGSRPQLP
jgi:hypothetical protein